MAEPNHPLVAEIEKAQQRLTATERGSPEEKAAAKALAALELAHREARRAAGEKLLSEEERKRPVPYGDFKDTLDLVKRYIDQALDGLHDRVDAIEGKKGKTAHRPTPGPAKRVGGKK